MTIIDTKVSNNYYEVFDSVIKMLSRGWIYENSNLTQKYCNGVKIHRGDNGNIKFYVNFMNDNFLTKSNDWEKDLLKKYAGFIKKLCMDYMQYLYFRVCKWHDTIYNHINEEYLSQFFTETGHIKNGWFNETNNISVTYISQPSILFHPEEVGLNRFEPYFKDIYKVSDCKKIYDLLMS